MLKQSFSKAKKVLTILLAVLFVASLTVGAASACNSHGHHHSCGSCNGYVSRNCCNGISCHKCRNGPHSHTCGCSHCHCSDDTACENDD